MSGSGRFDQFQSHAEMRMRRMRLPPQAIDDQNVDLVEQVDHLAGNLAEVRSVTDCFACLIEAKGRRLRRTVRHLAVSDTNAAQHANPVKVIEFDNGVIAVLPGKHVTEALAQAADSLACRIARNGPPRP